MIVDSSGRPYQSVGSGLTESQKVDKVMLLFSEWRSRLQRVLAEQMLVLDFVNNRQWTEKELARFTMNGRAPLTINIIATILAQVEGIQRLGQGDIEVKTVGGDKMPAEMTKKMLDAWSYDNRLDDLNNGVFFGGLTGYDSWHIYTEKDKKTRGYFKKVKVELPELGSVIYDPDFMTMQDMRGQLRFKYYYPDDIVRLWEKAKGLAFSSEEYKKWWQAVSGGELYHSFRHNFEQPLVEGSGRYGKYMVVECYLRNYETVKVLVNQMGQTVMEVPNGQPIDSQLVQQLGLYVMEDEKETIEKTIVLPYKNILLEESIDPYETWCYVPYSSGMKRCSLSQSSSFGFRMIGPQRRLNMNESNQNEFVTKSVRGGWMSDDKEDIEQLKKHGSDIQPIIKVKDMNRKPERIAPENISAALAEMARSQPQWIEMVSGVTFQQATGAAQPGEPGVVRRQRRQDSNTTAFPVIDMLNERRAYVAEAGVERMIKTMKPEQVVEMTGEDGNSMYVVATEEMIANYSKAKLRYRIMDGPFEVSQKEEEQESRTIAITTAQTINPIAAQVLLPGYIKGTSLPESEEAGRVVEQILAPIIAQGVANAIAPPTAGGLPGESPAPPQAA